MKALAGKGRRPIEIKLPPLHEGGEGTICAIEGQSDRVAKLPKDVQHVCEAKLQALRSRLQIATGTFCICAPQELLYSSKDSSLCIGCVMPYVSHARPLFQIYRELRNGKLSLKDGLSISRHLAEAFANVHQSHSQIADVNDCNVLVAAGNRVVIVDVDSFQVQDGGQVYRCNVGRPEYTPPELQGVSFSSIDRTVACDLFGLGVIIFSLLMRGFHPFAAGFSGSGNAPPLGTRIRNGVFPYAQRGVPHYRPKQSAPPYDALPAEVRRLFRRCFEGGHRDPHVRPTAKEWVQVLQRVTAADFAANCPTNVRTITTVQAFDRLRARLTKRLKTTKKIAVVGVIGAVSMGILAASVSHWAVNALPAGGTTRTTVATAKPTPRLWWTLANNPYKQ